MQLRIGITTTINVLVFFGIFAFCDAEENTPHEFPSIAERRIDIVEEKIESLGCVLDKRAISAAKDGQTIILKHKTDPSKNVEATFNSLVLPEGNWVLFGAKNSTTGEKSEEQPEKSPRKMEAVSAVLSGKMLNDWTTYRMVYVHVQRQWGWNIKLAKSTKTASSVYSFGYFVPDKSKAEPKKFKENQLPVVNILHRDEKDALLAGALYWFEKPTGEKVKED